MIIKKGMTTLAWCLQVQAEPHTPVGIHQE